MKHVLFFSIAVLVVSCKQGNIVNPETLKADIDQMPYSEMVYELTTDSIGNILDTTRISKIKRNAEDEIVLKEILYDKSREFTQKAYFINDKEYFYLLRYNADGRCVFRNYKYLNEKNDAVKSVLVSYEENGDSAIHTYESIISYNSDGNKQSVTAVMQDEDFDAIFYFTYNNLGDVISTIFTNNGDTTSTGKYAYTYENNVMREKRIISNGRNSWETIEKYDENTFLISRKIFENQEDSVSITLTEYENDNAGNVVSLITTTYPAESEVYKKYIREKL